MMKKLHNSMYSPIESRELKCNICNKYLSVLPIFHHDSAGSVCGRCYNNGETKKFNASIDFQRQKVYETFAKHLTFPCCYDINGCDSKLHWDDVWEHEKCCKFEKITCPTILEQFAQDQGVRCLWKGKNDALIPHMFADHHEELFSNSNKLEINCTQPRSFMSLLKISEDNALIVMFYKAEENSYFCDLIMDIPLVDARSITYDVEICGKTCARPVILPRNYVKVMNEVVFDAENPEDSLEIDISTLNKLLKQPGYLTLNFNILYGEDRVKLLSPREDCKKSQDIFLEMRCCHCGQLLFPPIYVCKTGHNFCSECKKKQSYCSICNQYYAEGTNTTLETVTKLSSFACENESRGCLFKTNYEQVLTHQKNCELTEKRCIITDCVWKGINSDMSKHINDLHSPLNCDQIQTRNRESNIYPILFDGKIFILTIIDVLATQSLKINVKCLGMQKGEYEYDLTFLHPCNNVKLVAHHLCQPLLFDQDGKEIQTPDILYPFDFYRQFIVDFQKFDFKVNIKKI